MYGHFDLYRIWPIMTGSLHQSHYLIKLSLSTSYDMEFPPPELCWLDTHIDGPRIAQAKLQTPGLYIGNICPKQSRSQLVIYILL